MSADAPDSKANAHGTTGRGASTNPPNRFEKLVFVEDPEIAGEEKPLARTEFLRDQTQSIITRNQSPDVGFEASLNPYRGCEHGCAYCFARPTHEYLGWSAGLDFETKILVKEKAPELLRRELSSPRWKPQVLVMSGVTDCYQPIERKLQLTRRCVEVLAEFKNPVAFITKNHLITRDIDLFRNLAEHHAVMVNVSVTTLDGQLAKVLEPRASSPTRRLAAIKELSDAGIPVRVMMAPVIPGLTDHEMPELLAAAADAGAREAAHAPLRLPWAVAPLFERWLDEHRPGEKEKVLGRIRSMRGGKLNDPNFGSRMRGDGFFAEQLHALFSVAARRAGFNRPSVSLSTAAFRVPTRQFSLFDR